MPRPGTTARPEQATDDELANDVERLDCVQNELMDV
jgi:hypothetical protein